MPRHPLDPNAGLPAPTPAPYCVLDADARIVFEPNDPYWSNVPLLRHEGDGRFETLRGDMTGRKMYPPDHEWKFIDEGVYGYLSNPLDPQEWRLVAPGEQPLDVRACLWDDLSAETIQYTLDGPLYLKYIRRHERRIAAAVKAGYRPLGYHVHKKATLLGIPGPDFTGPLTTVWD